MQTDFNSGNIKVIIGLGNPGDEYTDTYHNAGYLFIDYLEANSSLPKQKLIKSESFMNESGSYVAELIKRWKIAKPEETLVVHDDSDLLLGKYKFSFGSGSAGHKGVESIIKTLGTKDFWRLRIGIRRPEAGIRQKAEKIVLKKISAKDNEILEETFAKILPRLSV